MFNIRTTNRTSGGGARVRLAANNFCLVHGDSFSLLVQVTRITIVTNLYRRTEEIEEKIIYADKVRVWRVGAEGIRAPPVHKPLHQHRLKAMQARWPRVKVAIA